MLETGYIRIPGSRPHKLSPKKGKKQREQSWDNRFHLGKIPEYNAFHDRYLQNAVILPKKKIIVGVGRVRTRKDPSTKDLKSSTSTRFQNKSNVLKNQIINKLKQNLELMWDHKEIPLAQRKIFLDAIDQLPTKKKSTALVTELETFKNDKNFTQLVLRAIKARETSLVELKNFADSIKVPTSTLKHNSVESLINLRMLSLHVVECVQAWRKNLHEHDPPSVPDNLKFEWEGQNYLAKMLRDSHFLSSSPMAAFIEFSQNDPFFVNNGRQVGKIELPLPSYLLKRIKDCEKVLKSEGFAFTEFEERQRETSTVTRAKSVPLDDLLNEKIEFFSVGSNFPETLSKFSEKVPSEIQESMGKVSTVIENAMNLRFPAFLWAKAGGTTVGLASLNLDNQKSVQNRLLISHLSALNLQLFEKVIEALLNYLWSTYPCIEIRIGINTRINDKGKYECDPSIKSVFDKHSFRWKQMIYSQNQIPVQIHGSKRPDQNQNQKEISSNFSIFSDSLTLSYACGIQAKPPECPESFCSAVGIACAYRPYQQPFGVFSEILKNSKGIPPAFRFRKDSSLQPACRDLASLEFEFSSLEDERETSVSCSSLGLSWEKFLPVVFNDVKFTKVIGQINVMKSNDEVVYVFHTEDPVYSVFLIPYSSGNHLQGFQKSQEILKNMEKIEELKEIWIPDFEINGCFQADGIEERFWLRVATALHPLGGVFEAPKEFSVVIRSRFAFGMTHQKLVEDLDMPLYVFDVKPDDFIKI
jgi:hypothetical protein